MKNFLSLLSDASVGLLVAVGQMKRAVRHERLLRKRLFRSDWGYVGRPPLARR